MDKIILNFQVCGCPNHCFHCHCFGGNKSRELLDIDTVHKIASDFREKLNTEVSVYLLEEQTYYSDFFRLIEVLENGGFTKKDATKMLVTNCWGIMNTPDFIDKMVNHFSCVKPTLFGINDTHDIHAGRKGSYNEIIESSKKCIEKGLDVVWELLWTRLNTKELDSLCELGKSLGVKQVFISGEYLYSGMLINNSNKFIPIIDDLSQIKNEIYEYQQGYLKTVNQFVEDIKNGKTYNVEKVSLNQLYIDKNLNVYPLLHVSKNFLLGNIRTSFGKIIDQIKNETNLPESILNKRNLDFSSIVLKYGDTTSKELYTPQALFDKLSLKNI